MDITFPHGGRCGGDTLIRNQTVIDVERYGLSSVICLFGYPVAITDITLVKEVWHARRAGSNPALLWGYRK